MHPVEEAVTVRDRLVSLLDTVLQDSRINKAFIPTIKNLALNFLKDASDADITNGIRALRDKLIPWLLSEEAHDENTDQGG